MFRWEVNLRVVLSGAGPVPVAGERLVGGHVAENLVVLAEPQPRVDARPAGAARLGGLVAVHGEGVDLGRAVVVDKDRKSTRLNSSHLVISYAVFCLKK